MVNNPNNFYNNSHHSGNWNKYNNVNNNNNSYSSYPQQQQHNNNSINSSSQHSSNHNSNGGGGGNVLVGPSFSTIDCTSSVKITNCKIIDCKGHRKKARSVAWNCTGEYLASASEDCTAKIWNVGSNNSNSGNSNNSSSNDNITMGRELVSLSGHSDTVERVRWHPMNPNILCTASSDRTILLWDIRVSTNSTSSSVINNSRNSSSTSCGVIGRIDIVSNSKCPASVEWQRYDGRELAVAEKDNSVHVYDMRKLISSNSNTTKYYSVNTPEDVKKIPRLQQQLQQQKVYSLKQTVINECHFFPNNNTNNNSYNNSLNQRESLVAATKGTDGMGEIRIWQHHHTRQIQQQDSVFVGHTGPIYCLRFSPCGTKMATGGGDALIGLWDTNEMICLHTIQRFNKFVRSVDFSFDSKFIASSSEEPFIDIALTENGEKVGQVNAPFGADEIAWNPKSVHHLAYASGGANNDSTNFAGGSSSSSFVSVAKIKF